MQVPFLIQAMIANFDFRLSLSVVIDSRPLARTTLHSPLAGAKTRLATDCLPVKNALRQIVRRCKLDVGPSYARLIT